MAGRNGLRFAANYQVSPATVLKAVAGSRAAFRPGPELAKPHVCVSVDAVVGDDEDEAASSWQPGTPSGCSASDQVRAQAAMSAPKRHGRTHGQTRSALSSLTGCRPSSSARPIRSSSSYTVSQP